jgi:hypothetical protein
MRRRLQGLATAIVLALTLWIILDRLRIVIFVNVPWWGFLILAIVLFLAIDYIIAQVFRRSP